MTRKHFEILARSLKFAHPSSTWTFAHEAEQYNIAVRAWGEAVAAVADACAASNPRFDRPKFYEACQYNR